MKGRWVHFHHGADIGVRGEGDSQERAFEQCALALTAVVLSPDQVEPRTALPVRCSAPDPELLLADWLNALVYEMATRKMLFSRFAVTLVGQELTATAWGEIIDPARHHPAVEVKGATYTELRVEEIEPGGWIAQCVVDV